MPHIDGTSALFSTQVIEQSKSKLVLVDFWAEWCGPCRAIAPVLEELSNEMGEQVDVVKINVDEHPDLAQQYQIRGIPTMIFFKDGSPVETLVGGLSKSELAAKVSAHAA